MRNLSLGPPTSRPWVPFLCTSTTRNRFAGGCTWLVNRHPARLLFKVRPPPPGVQPAS